MKKDGLEHIIKEYLQQENINYLLVATTVGKPALRHLKKIIVSEPSLAKNALLLQQAILTQAQGEKSKASKIGLQEKMTLPSIATNRPDDQIKGFGSDMVPGKKKP